MSKNYVFAKVRQNGERFWTIVIEISGQNIKAIVDNDVFMQEFKCGDIINYLIDDVIEWQLPKISSETKEKTELEAAKQWQREAVPILKKERDRCKNLLQMKMSEGIKIEVGERLSAVRALIQQAEENGNKV